MGMAVLTPQERAKLPDEAFALPGRRYPIHDPAHAANALTRIKTYGTEAEARIVYRKVCQRYGDRIPACRVGFEVWWRGNKYRPPYQERKRRR